MAIKLDATDTHCVLTALQIYREQELESANETNYWRVSQIERLIKSYRRSFAALSRLDDI